MLQSYKMHVKSLCNIFGSTAFFNHYDLCSFPPPESDCSPSNSVHCLKKLLYSPIINLPLQCFAHSLTYLCLSLEDDHSPPLIPCGQQIPRLVKLHCRNDISYKEIKKIVLKLAVKKKKKKYIYIYTHTQYIIINNNKTIMYFYIKMYNYYCRYYY